MRAVTDNLYHFDVSAYNPYDTLEINSFSLDIINHDNAEQKEDLTFKISTSAYVYVDLDQYFAFEPMAGVMTGEFRDSKNKVMDEPPPEVESAYEYRISSYI